MFHRRAATKHSGKYINDFSDGIFPDCGARRPRPALPTPTAVLPPDWELSQIKAGGPACG